MSTAIYVISGHMAITTVDENRFEVVSFHVNNTQPYTFTEKLTFPTNIDITYQIMFMKHKRQIWICAHVLTLRIQKVL